MQSETNRVLLIAEACNPTMVSVPLEGWSHCDAIRCLEEVNATIVTQIRNRAALVEWGLREGTDFIAIDTERVAAPAHRFANAIRGGQGKGWTTVMAIRSLTYPYFEQQVWRRLGKRIRAGEFDVVHRITPLSPTTSSLLAGRCRRAGVPFIAGPLNGGVPWPRQFQNARRREREWLSYVRGMHQLVPGFHSTRRNAAALIIGSEDTWRQMPERYHDKCVYIPENGIDPDRFSVSRKQESNSPLRIVFVGRLVPYKGADMLIESVAELLRQRRANLTIVGDGPERAALESLCDRLGCRPHVHFTGRVSHGSVQQFLSESDVFAFPSIREFGGAVALEAMAVGLVPIVVGYGGLNELVTDQTGYRIAMGTREAIVADFRERLSSLAKDPTPLLNLAKNAKHRVRELFTWNRKASQVEQVYRWVTGMRSTKPDWGMPFTDANTSMTLAR